MAGRVTLNCTALSCPRCGPASPSLRRTTARDARIPGIRARRARGAEAAAFVHEPVWWFLAASTARLTPSRSRRDVEQAIAGPGSETARDGVHAPTPSEGRDETPGGSVVAEPALVEHPPRMPLQQGLLAEFRRRRRVVPEPLAGGVGEDGVRGNPLLIACAGRKWASAPWAAIARAVSRPASSRMSARTRRAPASAAASAKPRPRPRAAPVIRIRLPAREMLVMGGGRDRYSAAAPTASASARAATWLSASVCSMRRIRARPVSC